MRNIIFIVAFSLVMVSVSAACGAHDAKNDNCCGWMKTATIVTDNIENGVAYTITTDKPEGVKDIQKNAINYEKKRGKCSGKCCEWMKDAKTEIEHIENGVVYRVTSDNPEIVKRIHQHSSEFGKGCSKDKSNPGGGHSNCPHKKSHSNCPHRKTK